MLVDFNQNMLDEENSPIEQAIGEKMDKKIAVTLKWVCLQVLFRMPANDDDPAEIYNLGNTINTAPDGPIELTVEQVALLRARIRKYNFFPIVSGQAILMLDSSQKAAAA